MTSVRRALALSFIERYFSIVLALGSNMALARLLTPEQIGMYSVTLAVIGLAHVLREFGVGNYLIQQKDLNDDHVRTAFGLALTMGATLAVAIYSAAPWAARFYSAPGMAGLMRIVALNFLVLPFCSISLSLLRRAMKFKALLYVNLAALSLGTAVTLALAWAGQGPTSMAVGAVVGNVATGLGAWWARGRPAPLRPGWKEWRAVLNFGGQSAATGIVTSLAMDINDLVVGKVLGLAPVAVLSRAQGLVSLFYRDVMGAVRNVALPAMAAAHRRGEALEAQHIHAMACICVIAWPFYLLLAAFPLPVLRLMFGPQWDAAAELVPWLALAGAIAAPCSLVTTLLMASGRIDLVTKLELTVQAVRIVTILTAVFVFEALLPIAVATVVVFGMSAIVTYWVKGKELPTQWGMWLDALLRSALVAVTSAAAAIGVSLLGSINSDTPLGFFACVVAAALMWPLAVMVFNHPLRKEPIIGRLIARSVQIFSRAKPLEPRGPQ